MKSPLGNFLCNHHLNSEIQFSSPINTQVLTQIRQHPRLCPTSSPPAPALGCGPSLPFPPSLANSSFWFPSGFCGLDCGGGKQRKGARDLPPDCFYSKMAHLSPLAYITVGLSGAPAGALRL